MKYLINKTNYHTFDIFEDHKLEGRSYFIPYKTKEELEKVSLKEKRYKSSKVISLNGDWDFKFYPHPKDLKDEIDTDDIAFDKIDVPSCVQFRGYDKPFYVNVRYQFPFNPPIIPKEESVGKVFSWIGADQKISPRFITPKEQYNFVLLYRRHFDIDDISKGYIISFLGVASCLDLYLNGQYVGYSEGAHNTAEFDLTRYVIKGKNELVAVVHRWCNGTYLESQDMFRNNGIFRDVLLRINDKEDVFDFDVKTSKNNGKYQLFIKIKPFYDTKFKVVLDGQNIHLEKSVTTKNKVGEVSFNNLDVLEWNAETPYLYYISIESKTSYIEEAIGFKDIKIEKDLFKFNGNLIKFHGVNHHDTSPTNGYTMTLDEIEKDVKLCKKFNIDTIRTSHYPPDPYLLELADLYGIYIVDENDIETHGVWANHFPPNYNIITDDKRWEKHFIDRISRLYQRDKIHANTSIIMWSLGNEAGGYYNTDRMYEYLKKRSSLPIHYESAIHSKRVAYDVGSEMYPPTDKVRLVGEHSRKEKPLNDRPYFLCEYAHAMGVGPGNIDAYWDVIYQYDNLIGGCVWEMVDHAVKHEDGSYTYGGDHDEWEHDGNFCVDGIFYPDRRASTGAYIVKHCYRPIRVKYIKDDIFEIFNTTAFTNAKEYRLKFLYNDGTSKDYYFDVPPLTKKQFKVPLGKEVDGRILLTIICYDKDKVEKSKEQIIIKDYIRDIKEYKPLPDNFSCDNGKISIKLNEGESLLQNDEYNILYRASTDNDVNLLYYSSLKGYQKQNEKILSVTEIENGIMVKTEVSNKKAKYLVTDIYHGCDEGVVVISTLHSLNHRNKSIPRFGKSFYLVKEFDDVSYLARNGETYLDMKEQFVISETKCKVLGMTEPNIKPQESGNRMDCMYASISSKKNKVTFEALSKRYELAVKPYTDKALLNMRHQKDEVRTGTYITIQAFQQGIGTGSCGPGVSKEYLYPANKDYVIKFLIKIK